MVVAPDAGVIVVLPLVVDIQVSEMIALWNRELFSDLITLLLTTLQKDRDRTVYSDVLAVTGTETVCC